MKKTAKKKPAKKLRTWKGLSVWVDKKNEIVAIRNVSCVDFDSVYIKMGCKRTPVVVSELPGKKVKP
jgi:hypothetical protein